MKTNGAVFLMKEDDEGRDNMEHYVGECRVTTEWLMVLGKNKEEIIKRIYSEDLEGRIKY